MQDITYSYDSASNITHVSNSAGSVSGLGGRYEGHYTYDNLYRLVAANGYWKNSRDSLPFSESMNYTANGRILKKTVNARILNGNHSTTKSSDFRYSYAGHGNQVSTITDNGTFPVVTQSFLWDDCGNVDRWAMLSKTGTQWLRTHTWTEDNRLQTVVDNNWFSYYQYDANGDRIYKLTGEFARQNRNGDWNYFYWMKRPTLYASPYLVSNEKGYTKHYYTENERIASRIGGGRLDNIDMNVNQELFVVHHERSKKLFNKVLECLDVRAEAPESLLKFLYEWKDIREEEKECYWYHPDHLGSSSWITFSDGKAVEHLHYMPWGEDFVRQRSTDWHAMYTFSAKEKDTETGYSYFGARYYSSDLSVWLSVDPMASKYPSLSPYVYCADNPVKYIDPNGETPIAAIMEGIGAFMISAGLDFLNNWLVYGQDYSTAFNKVSWGTAAIDGVTTFFSSFFLSGTGSAKYMSKISNSKLTHFAIEIFNNMVTNVTTKLESGTKFKDINLIEELLYATFSSLVGNGMEKRADELLKRVHSTNQKLYNRCLKQERNIKAQKNDARLRSDARQVNISKQAANRTGVDYAREQTKNTAFKKTATQVTRDAIDGIKDAK